MKVLAIETTDRTGSLAAGTEDGILGSQSLRTDQRSAQSLVPGIDLLLKELGWKPSDLEVIAVAKGPGSFTGLRVGVTTAKMLAWSLGARLIGVDTLEALAIRLPRTGMDRIVDCAVDAQRGDVARRSFFVGSKPEDPLIPFGNAFSLCSANDWLHFDIKNSESIKENGEKNTVNRDLFPDEVNYSRSSDGFDKEAEKEGINSRRWENGLKRAPLLCGPILARWKDRIGEEERENWADEAFWLPSANGVFQVALERIRQEHWDDVWSLLPIYSRRSAAEEKLQR